MKTHLKLRIETPYVAFVDPQSSERRKSTRSPLENVPAAVVVGGHDLGLHTVVDASTTGAFVRHASPVLPVGTEIMLIMPSTTGKSPLRLGAKVARVVAAGVAGSGYGVNFIRPPDDVLVKIAALHEVREQTRDVPRASSGTRDLPDSGATRDLPHPAPREASATRDLPKPRAPSAPPRAQSGFHPLRHLDLTKDVSALVVDNDAFHGTEVVRALAAMGVVAVLETTAARAMDTFQLRRRTLGLIVVDLLLPDMSGEAMISKLKAEKPGLQIIATTSVLRTVSAQRPLLKAGASRVLTKPVASRELGTAVRELLTLG